jgi:hypothetical protein
MTNPPNGINDGAFTTQPEQTRAPRTNPTYPYPTGIEAAPLTRHVRSDPYRGGYTDFAVETNRIVNDNRSPFATRASRAQEWLAYERRYFPLPSVKKFCKILVVLGVVYATIYMIFGAYSVIMGHKDAGQRVVGCAAGLILLLMSYCIYKVVMINALRIRVRQPVVDGIGMQDGNTMQPLQNNDTPIVPNRPPGRQRSNLQVSPYASHP